MNSFDIGMLMFNVGNFVLLLGTLLLLKTVIKDRNVLKGYDMIGSIITLAGLLGFCVAYVLIRNWVSLALCAPTVMYWGLVSFYTIKKKMSNA